MKKIILFLLIFTISGFAQYPKYPKFPDYQKKDTTVIDTSVIPLFTNPVWTEITNPDPITLRLTLNPSCIDTVNGADSISIVFRTTNAVSGFLTTDEGDTIYGVTMDSVFNDSIIGLSEYGVYFGNTWADTTATVTAYITFYLNGVANSNVQTLVRAFTIPRTGDVVLSTLQEDAGHDTVFFDITNFAGGVTGLTSDTYIYIRPYCLNDDAFWADSVGGDYSNWSGSPEGYDDIGLDSTAETGDSLVIQQRILIWHDPTINWRTEWRTISDTLVFDFTAPLAGGLTVSGVNYDSAQIVITREGGAENKAYYMVRYDPNTIPADTSTGTLALTWRAYVNVDTTIYVNVPADSGNTLSYWFAVFTKDSLGNVDNSSDEGDIPNTPVPTLASYVADTLSTDSVEFTLSGYVATGSSILRTWVGMSYSPINPDTSAYGDSTYALSDSVSSIHWAHALTNEDTLYFYAITMNADGRLSIDYIDTLVVPDQWSPVAGSLNITVAPIGMATLSILSFGGTADLASVYLDLWSGSAWVNVFSAADSSTDTTIENSAINSVPFNPDSTLRARLRLYDEAGNSSTKLDTTNDDSARTVTVVSDTARSKVQALRIFTSADSNGTKLDSCYVLDMDTTAGADTITVKVYSPTDTLWYAARPKIAGAWGTLGAWYKFPSGPSVDTTPPTKATSYVAQAIYQSDSLQITVSGFATDIDSMRLNATQTSGYPGTRTSDSLLWAGSDTSLINDTTFALAWFDVGDTTWTRLWFGDTLDNWTSVAQVNQDTAVFKDTTAPDTGNVFTALSIDSTGINLIWTGFPTGFDSARVQYSDTGFVSGRTAGTNLYAGHDSAAFNNDNFTGLDLTCNKVYYISAFLGDAADNWTAVANKDTLKTAACAVASYCATVGDRFFADSSDFFLTFDHTDGDSVACLGTSGTENGTWLGGSSATPDSGVSPGSGGNAFIYNASNDQIEFDNTGGYFSSTAGQFTFSFMTTNTTASILYLVGAVAVESQDRIQTYITDAGRINVQWEDNDGGAISAQVALDYDGYYGDWCQVQVLWNTGLATTAECSVRVRVDDNRDGDFGDGGVETWQSWVSVTGALDPFASEPGANEIEIGKSGTYNVNLYIDDVEFSNNTP